MNIIEAFLWSNQMPDYSNLKIFQPKVLAMFLDLNLFDHYKASFIPAANQFID